MAAIFLGLAYWNFKALWDFKATSAVSGQTSLPQFNMGPLAMAIFAAVFGMIVGPIFGQLTYRRLSDRIANFIAFVSLIIFGIFAVGRYGFSPPTIPFSETFSDDFTTFLIAVVLVSSAFPCIHYIINPNPKNIRRFLTEGTAVKKRRRTTAR